MLIIKKIGIKVLTLIKDNKKEYHYTKKYKLITIRLEKVCGKFKTNINSLKHLKNIHLHILYDCITYSHYEALLKYTELNSQEIT